MNWNLVLVLGFIHLRFVSGQFHQNTYTVEHERIEITNYNKTAVVDPEIKVFKYNETLKMKAISGSATFTPGVKKNILINFSLYKFMKNDYRPFPINITIDLCEQWTKNTFGMQAAVTVSNFRGCPCAVGYYYMKDFILQDSLLPPHIPYGKYKLAVHVRIDDTVYLARGAWYGSIVPKTQ